jgi:2-succinyl-5-enolpyruvyl-6-hydroxy-3-cyclohexene-1-carboxylate synthase
VNPSTALARRLVDELVGAGVREAVLCPGSRNAPLSFALHAADAAGRLRLHVRIDERTAAFLALGLARRSGRAVPVVCTSGTAAANLHPAVLEASHGGVPLLAVTADRPAELIGTGANQTIVQPDLYGVAPRGSWSLSPVDGAGVGEAVAVALGAGPGGPGPVHLNVPFAEPLVPEPPAPGTLCSAYTYATAPGGAYVYAEQSDELPLDPEAPTLVIGGSVPVGVGAPELPEGLPVIAEPSSPLWPSALRAGPWVLGAVLGGGNGAPRPEQVVLHGRPTLHRAVTRLIADPATRVYGIAGTNHAGWPAGTRAVGSLPDLRPPTDFRRSWADADAAAGALLDDLPTGTPTGLRLASALVAALPDGAMLTVGSSNPVRDVALAARPRAGLTVLANRGVAGIDGTVSTAVGATLAHRGPGYALLGDLTLLHDTTGLLLGPDEPVPDLTVVVLNDAGGGIFSLLEQGAPEFAPEFERVFGTPHRARLDQLCAGFGVAHRLLDDVSELPQALPGAGIRVLELRADRTGLRAGHAALRTAVDAAIDAALS